MADLLPNLNIAPIVKPYSGAPIKEFDETVARRIQDYDLAAETDDILQSQSDLLLSNVLPFKGDKNNASSLIDYYNQRIQERAEKGDFENMLRQTKRDVRDFTAKIQPLIERKKQFSEFVNTINKREDLLDRQKTAAINYVTKLNDREPELGTTLGNIQTISPAAYVDATELLDERLKGIKEEGRSGYVSIPDQYGNIKKVKVEEIKEEDVARMATNILKGSNEFQSYLSSEAMLGNQDKVANEMQSAINYVIDKYGFRKTDSSIETIKTADGDEIPVSEIDFSTLFPSTFAIVDGNVQKKEVVLDDQGNITKLGKNKTLSQSIVNRLNQGDPELDKVLNKNLRTDQSAANVGSAQRFDVSGITGLIEGIKDYFSSKNEKLTDKQEKELEGYTNGLEELNKIRSTQGEAPLNLKQYISSMQTDSNNAFKSYISKKQRDNYSEQFFDPKTGGGTIVNKTIIPSFDAKNVAPGIPITAKEFFKEEFDIDITDVDQLEDLKLKGATLVGQLTPFNSNSAAGHMGSMLGQNFIIQETPSRESSTLHKLYKLAKLNGSGTTEIPVPQPDGEIKMMKVKYIYDPYSPTGFRTIDK